MYRFSLLNQSTLLGSIDFHAARRRRRLLGSSPSLYSTLQNSTRNTVQAANFRVQKICASVFFFLALEQPTSFGHNTNKNSSKASHTLGASAEHNNDNQ